MTFLSIIIPFDTAERYLKDCLDSISYQNLNDTEVIIILNGNQENVDDLIKSYDDLNIITKYFDERIGVASARNVGLDIASGIYVYFIDADDYIYKDALKRLVDVAKTSNADLINGERYVNAFIYERFEEVFLKRNKEPQKQGKLSDLYFSMGFVVGQKTNNKEVISILHSLIKRDKIGEKRFDETDRYYSDYYFFADILPNLNSFKGVENAFYGKRNRDDSINLTSLNQEPRDDPFLDYAAEYHKVLNIINEYYENDPQEKYLALKNKMADLYFDYYMKVFSKNYLNSPNNNWRTIVYDGMQKIVPEFNMDDKSFLQKREIKAFRQGNKSKFTKFMRLRVGMNTLRSYLRNRWKFTAFFYHHYYNKKPVNEKQIIFTSFSGKFYSDSPKYLYEYLYQNYGDEYDYVWIINNKKIKIPGNPKRVKRFSLSYYKEIARSKYWVINGRQPARLNKKRSQEIISTWHGTPLKKLGLDIGNVYTKNPHIKKSYMQVSNAWKYLISPNHFTTGVLRSAFGYNGTILETGYPRNDILYNATDSQIKQIKKDLNLPEDKKIILYAPTWRDDEYYDAGQMHFELNLELDKLQNAIGDEYILLVRTHYFVADKLDLTPYKGFAYDVSKYEDIAELYLISDILITDYSSVFFDYANLKRPILFYTYDLDKYENVLRGFYIDIHTEVPGPLLKTTEEVIYSILNIDSLKEEYSDKYDQFYERFCSIEDGNASKRIIDEIMK